MVKCVECGFLATRTSAHGRTLDCATDKERRTGEHVTHSEFPICAANKVSLFGEILRDKQPNATLRILGSERECERFITWEPSLGLKEHRELQYNQQMLATDRAWREEQARIDREWREKQADDERVWRRDERFRHFLELIVVALIVPLVGWLFSFANRANSSPPAAKMTSDPDAVQNQANVGFPTPAKGILAD